MEQFDLSRAAVESLSGAKPALVRTVMGIKGPRIPWEAYVLPIGVGIAADVLIVLAGAARGSQQYTGLMLLVEAALLGFLFGARMGMVATLVPLVAIGIWLLAPLAVGSSDRLGLGRGDRGLRLRPPARRERQRLRRRPPRQIPALEHVGRPCTVDCASSTTGWGGHGTCLR